MEAKFHAQFYKTQPDVTLVDLAKFVQALGERAEDYISHFKITKQRCITYLLEKQFVKLYLNSLEFKLNKNFEEMGFNDFFKSATKAASYGRLLKEEADWKRNNRAHIHAVLDQHEEDPEVEIGEIIADKPVPCPPLVRAKGGKDD
ncbi:hypothetical protein CRG98_040353 [Punica granatum]|uniref:Retrotransposon gag domain-containing protein n=1 Tax=Punica granatum TaxID=22663 RepID=A0A2I0I5P3_PUNGR|nr:hypothetical protein CRG98_040353 [Punica granatum]